MNSARAFFLAAFSSLLAAERGTFSERIFGSSDCWNRVNGETVWRNSWTSGFRSWISSNSRSTKSIQQGLYTGSSFSLRLAQFNQDTHIWISQRLLWQLATSQKRKRKLLIQLNSNSIISTDTTRFASGASPVILNSFTSQFELLSCR